MILEAFYVSPDRAMLLWLGAGLVAVVAATAFGQIRLNAGNQPFYHALSRKDLPVFGSQLLVFVCIAGALLSLNMAQTWLNQLTKMKLREGLTRDLFAQWLAPKRAFLLAGAKEIGENPDQRLHEDARHLAELSTDLGVGLVQATLLLASFIGVQWILSAGVTFELQWKSFVIPGYMVWSALLYAGAASWASWRVGRPLIHLNAERYARESDLRFALVHVNEHSDGIAVYRGEAKEKDRLHRELDRLLVVLRRLVGATTGLTWITAGYGWFTIVAPIVVATPAYFAGDLSFGGLLMAVGAFNQVQQSLRWFVDNCGLAADALSCRLLSPGIDRNGQAR
jgi:vitamin B12/bleomycin/antimicrobial peptide transport system ATP-binding/permease protein